MQAVHIQVRVANISTAWTAKQQVVARRSSGRDRRRAPLPSAALSAPAQAALTAARAEACRHGVMFAGMLLG
jgi:hypothetical protein